MIVPANEEQIARAAQVLRAGGLVAFPTETVYGLGANALDAEAVARIYAAKKRPFASPVIVHVASIAMAQSLSEMWPPLAGELARHFWPGPLTIVMKKAAVVPDIVSANLDSVGLRMPRHPVALKLIEHAGVPIAAPSANRFTEVSPTTAQHVADSLGAAVDLILDGGPTEVGIESTVVSLRRSTPLVFRPGIVTQRQLEHATGMRWERETDQPHLRDEEPHEAPGQFPRHYAPRTKFYVLPEGVRPAQGRGRFLELPYDSAGYAARLYAELRQADGEGWDWIAVHQPPGTDEWDGIRDRLQRASQS